MELPTIVAFGKHTPECGKHGGKFNVFILFSVSLSFQSNLDVLVLIILIL